MALLGTAAAILFGGMTVFGSFVFLMKTLIPSSPDADNIGHSNASLKLMKLWPQPNNEEQNIIHYTYGSQFMKGNDFISQLDSLFDEYMKLPKNSESTLRMCDGTLPPVTGACFFDLRNIPKECSRERNYGYDIGRPCIFLQFASVIDWKPEPYTDKESMRKVSVPRHVQDSYNPNLAFITCQGNTPIDRQFMGPIEYWPVQGFPLYFFPYEMQKHYMPPLVAVRFTRPYTGIAIGITCRIWAENINQTDNASASIHFNLLVE